MSQDITRSTTASRPSDESEVSVSEPRTFSYQDMQASAASASNLLKSMANESRLMILCQLVEGERSVAEILKDIPLGQSALSQHLAILRRERLVTTRREGQSIFYSLASHEVRAIIATLHDLYCS